MLIDSIDVKPYRFKSILWAHWGFNQPTEREVVDGFDAQPCAI
jgi:hypothetical protein